VFPSVTVSWTMEEFFIIKVKLQAGVINGLTYIENLLTKPTRVNTYFQLLG